MRRHKFITTLMILVFSLMGASVAKSESLAPSAKTGHSFATVPEMELSPTTQSENKPRVFVTDSQTWELQGGFPGGGTNDGDRPISVQVQNGNRQIADTMGTLNEKCSDVIVTAKREKADYAVILDRPGDTNVSANIIKDKKYVVYKKDGDVIKGGSARTVGGAIKGICEAIKKDWETTGKQTGKTN